MRAPRFWDGPPIRADARAAALTPVSWAWTTVHRLRWRLGRPLRVPVPVVCVGNVVAGGAGKTPLAIAVAKRLREHGLAPHFLTRGTGGSLKGPVHVNPAMHSASAVGDEALLLAESAHTWVARDRRAGAQAAVRGGADVLIMDDGFQSPNVVKDVSLLVVDDGFGIGNGRIFPAGPLREAPLEAAARATAMVRVRTPGGGSAPLGRLTNPPVPVMRAELEPNAEDRELLNGARVVAFTGIGSPVKFFSTLDAIGCVVVGARSFPDHHRFRGSDLAALQAEAEALEAMLVTTAKDAVRLPEAIRKIVTVLRVAVRFEDEAALDEVLAPVRRP